MNTAFDSLTHKMQRAALGKTVDLVLSHAEKDPAKTVGQIVDLSKQFYGNSFSDETYAHAKQTLTDPDSKWSKLINCVLNQLNPNVARTTALNLGYEAFFRGTKTIRENRVKYQCNVPWLILFDPTSACNMHCVGCWAGEYGNKNNLSFDDMDKIVSQGKETTAYSDVYSALETGQIDAAENNWPAYYSMEHYKVARYYMADEHSRVPEVQLVSGRTWDALPEEYRQTLQACARVSAQYERQLWAQEETTARKAALAGGCRELPLPEEEMQSFRQLVQPLYRKYCVDYLPLVEEIQAE